MPWTQNRSLVTTKEEEIHTLAKDCANFVVDFRVFTYSGLMTGAVVVDHT